ncbi:MAG: hypothetical protein J6W90_04340, partial [Verrucomicrobia bacterium]|nr:hypothetical protein [Verrucomicrobiota bacterium]
YYAWGKGEVENCGSEYRLYFEYKFYDPYDWHIGNTFWISIYAIKIPVRSDTLIAMHMLKLAQEFKMYGSVKENNPVSITKRN